MDEPELLFRVIIRSPDSTVRELGRYLTEKSAHYGLRHYKGVYRNQRDNMIVQRAALTPWMDYQLTPMEFI